MEALNNSERGNFSLYGTGEGISRLKKEVRFLDKLVLGDNIKTFDSNHDFQTFSKKTFTDFGFKPTRIMNGLFLISDSRKFIQVGKFLISLKIEMI